MEEFANKKEERAALAEEALGYARDALLSRFRFMNRPVSHVPARICAETVSCETDAQELRLAPWFVFDAIRARDDSLVRAYLHMTLHCLLRHTFPPEGAHSFRWSVACDMAAAAVAADLGAPAALPADPERDAVLARFVSQVENPTALELYALIGRMQATDEQLSRLDSLFAIDDHSGWFQNAGASDSDEAGFDEPSGGLQQRTQERREKIARQTEHDLSRQADGEASALSSQLESLSAESMGLEELLRQFTLPQERMRIDPDEFDYVYYSYGLRLYGNVALMEPLEYREVPEVRDFVVALDTSGSVDERLARLFVRRACGMLLAGDSLGERSCVRIIQCDDAVRDERVVRTAADVEAYLAAVELKGRGLTDFRPVFEHVDGLIERGEVEDVVGLVYFTDGEGLFPEQAPAYDTAFVFAGAPAAVPPWATSVVTCADELE